MPHTDPNPGVVTPRPVLTVAVLLAVCALGLGVGLGSARAITNHEMYVVAGARQMVESGDWLVPRVGLEPWLEKPPMLHWLCAASGWALGFHEAAMRLPSALAAAVSVLCAAWIARRTLGPGHALLAGLVQATSVHVVTYGRLAEADMALAAVVAGMDVCLVGLLGLGEPAVADGERARAQRRRIEAFRWGFWVLAGLSNLLKGPLFGMAMTLAPAGVWLAWRRDGAGARRLLHPPAMALALALASAWPLAVAWREPGAWELWRLHLLGRTVGEMGLLEPWWYYAGTWAWQMLPWTPMLVIAATSLRRRRPGLDSPEALLWALLIVPAVLLSFSKGKHHHYLIHALFAAAPLAALGTLRYGRWLLSPGPWPRAWLWLCAAAPLPAAAVLIALRPRLGPLSEAMSLALTLGLAAVVCAAAVCGLMRRLGSSLAIAVAGVVGAIVAVHLTVLPARDPSAKDTQFLRELAQRIPTDSPLIAAGDLQVARVLFHLGDRATGGWDLKRTLATQGDAAELLVITWRRLEPALSAWGRWERVAQSEGSRKERGPGDRLALYRVWRSPQAP